VTPSPRPVPLQADSPVLHPKDPTVHSAHSPSASWFYGRRMSTEKTTVRLRVEPSSRVPVRSRSSCGLPPGPAGGRSLHKVRGPSRASVGSFSPNRVGHKGRPSTSRAHDQIPSRDARLGPDPPSTGPGRLRLAQGGRAVEA